MKNKGLTLIELLAVIIVIATIFMIISVSVLGRINDSKKSNAINSAKSYIKAVNAFLLKADSDLDNQFDIDELAFSTNDNGEKEYKPIKISYIVDEIQVENGPTGQDTDYIKIDDNYIITEALLTFNGFKIKYFEKEYCVANYNEESEISTCEDDSIQDDNLKQ